MADHDSPPSSAVIDPGASGGIPGSASNAHPSAAIPLPEHGFAILDDAPLEDLIDVPAIEVITESAVMLMNAAARKLGLAPDGEPQLDLDDARQLITALAGLVAASQDHLGPHRTTLRDGLKTLQDAFRAASSVPDAPGQGPGENVVF